MTLAPERAGAHERIRRLRARGVLVSLGHTEATYEEFISGVDAGAAMATHLYNAMSPFAHRAPGAIGASLGDDRITAGLIADGVHSHPASLRLAVRAKGARRIALVSDLMPAAGMPPGRYEFGGQPVIVDAVLANASTAPSPARSLPSTRRFGTSSAGRRRRRPRRSRWRPRSPRASWHSTDGGRIAVGCLADLCCLTATCTSRATIICGAFAVDRNRGCP